MNNPERFLSHESSVWFNAERNFVSIFDSQNLYEFYLGDENSVLKRHSELQAAVTAYQSEVMKLEESPSREDAAKVLRSAAHIYDELRRLVPGLNGSVGVDFYVSTLFWSSNSPVPDERNPEVSRIFSEAMQDVSDSLISGQENKIRRIYVGTGESLGFRHIILQLWRKESHIKPKTILQYDVTDYGSIKLSLLADEQPALFIEEAFLHRSSEIMPKFANVKLGSHAYLNKTFGREFPVFALTSLNELYSHVGSGGVREASSSRVDIGAIDYFVKEFDINLRKFKRNFRVDPISGNATFRLGCEPPKLDLSNEIGDFDISTIELVQAAEDYIVETSSNFILRNRPMGLSATDSVIGWGRICMYPGLRDRIASRLGLINLAYSLKPTPVWMLKDLNFFESIRLEWDRVISVLNYNYIDLDIYFDAQDIQLVDMQSNVLTLIIQDKELKDLFKNSDLHQELRFLLFAKFEVLFLFKFADVV